MSGIKEKLSRLKRGSGNAGLAEKGKTNGVELTERSSEPSAAIEAVGRFQGGRAEAERPARPIEEVPIPPSLDPRWSRLGVMEMNRGADSFLIRERRYGLEEAHGDHLLGELKCRTGLFSAMTAGVDREPGERTPVDVETLLFLDTETTGLGVGAGNVPFMIGLGYYEADCFVVQQLFIRNPAEERAMHVYLQELLASRNRLVTYNGKCFDWPLVKNRFVLNRLRLRGEEPEHFDLLYPSRSLWRNSLPSCRLSIVERSRLGLSRIDDVPGSMAPELYFLFLAEKNPAVLSGVFEHNEKDVLTLATLSVHLAKLLEGVIPLEGLDNEELYRMALWMEKLGEEAKAREAMDLLASRPSASGTQHALWAAAFYKRRHRYDLAVPIWRELTVASGRGDLAQLEPLIELAMYYEHRERDLAEALYMAETALTRVWNRLSLSRGDTKLRAACEQLQQRIARLQKKASGVRRKRQEPLPAPDGAAAEGFPAAPARRRRKPSTVAHGDTLFTMPNG